MALNDKSDFDKNPTSGTADDGDTHALIADMAFGVALTFGVTSAVLLFTKDEPPAVMPSTAGGSPASPSRTADLSPERTTKRKDVTVTPTPWVGPHGGGAGVVLRF